MYKPSVWWNSEPLRQKSNSGSLASRKAQRRVIRRCEGFWLYWVWESLCRAAAVIECIRSLNPAAMHNLHEQACQKTTIGWIPWCAGGIAALSRDHHLLLPHHFPRPTESPRNPSESPSALLKDELLCLKESGRSSCWGPTQSATHLGPCNGKIKESDHPNMDFWHLSFIHSTL